MAIATRVARVSGCDLLFIRKAPPGKEGEDRPSNRSGRDKLTDPGITPDGIFSQMGNQSQRAGPPPSGPGFVWAGAGGGGPRVMIKNPASRGDFCMGMSLVL